MKKKKNPKEIFHHELISLCTLDGNLASYLDSYSHEIIVTGRYVFKQNEEILMMNHFSSCF